VPDNVPNREMLAAHIGKPLSAVPDPFSNEYPSFAAHNNARLRRFLDRFGFEYEFLSATECYQAGLFDATLMRMLEVYDKVMDIILPTWARAPRPPTRRSSRFTHERQGAAGADVERDAKRGTIVYVDPRRRTGGDAVTAWRLKCQWKADWAMRWSALGVDYEMWERTDRSVTLSSKICRALGSAARELHLRAVPRRGRRQDLEVQGQRPHRRRDG
jgi:lysyl-tRNA synthetase class 1